MKVILLQVGLRFFPSWKGFIYAKFKSKVMEAWMQQGSALKQIGLWRRCCRTLECCLSPVLE